MPATVSDRRFSTHRELPEKADRMAAAHLRKAESEAIRREKIGKAFAQASEPWSLGELSLMLGGRDERQIARWRSGAERVQMDALLGCDLLWSRMVVALARLTPELVEIETTLRVRTA